MFTPIQVASTVALDEYGDIPQKQIVPLYKKRRDVMVEAFRNAGWNLTKPKASMFIWGKIPEICQDMGSLEFSKRLLVEAKVAVSPGIGFWKSMEITMLGFAFNLRMRREFRTRQGRKFSRRIFWHKKV